MNNLWKKRYFRLKNDRLINRNTQFKQNSPVITSYFYGREVALNLSLQERQVHMNPLLTRLFLTSGLISLTSCGDISDHYTKKTASTYDAAGLFIALSENEPTVDQRFIYISVAKEISSLLICENSDATCGSGSIQAKLHRADSDRNIYVSSETIQLRKNLNLRIESKINDRAAGFSLVQFNQNSDSTKPDSTDFFWKDHISMIDVSSVRFNGNTYGSNVFQDTMTHVKTPYLQDGPLTSVHESMHFILHENANKSQSGGKFIYAGNGKGAFWPEARLTTRTFETFIPRAVVAKAKLYNTYIKSRPDQVLGENIFDEWLAYITETYTLIESHRAGTPTPNDSVEGASTEFLYYCAAAMHALHEKEPDHLEKENVKALFAMLAERSRWIVDNLQTMDALSKTRTTELFQHLQSDPSSQGIRDALTAIYGSTWTQRVLGF